MAAMAWWNLSSDIAGAVTKLSESVKSIEKNFDSALGLEASLDTRDPAADAGLDLGSADSQPDLQPQRSESSTDADADAEADATAIAVPIPVSARAEEAQDQVHEVRQPERGQLEEEQGVREVADKAECSPDQAPELELRMMETALQGAAKQAQAKADEISRLLVENDQLKCALEEAKRSNAGQVELEAVREDYQHKLGAAERKVYTLTKERDMLRRDLSRKSDSSALLKEKDEIIKQVMAEGEELSKKQAAQEAQIRKLRAQVRELEEEKQRLNSKLQIEESKVDSLRKDKASTEKTLQENVDKSHADLAAQREFYTKMVNEAREAEAQAEARASSQAKADLDQRLHEAAQRESALVQALEELRQGLSRGEQQAAYREEVLRKDIESLERRCQDAETRYDDLVARVPESTRPLLRQIEAMQESSAMRAEAWNGAERALNSRLQEAEAKAAAAAERERVTDERLSQTLSRLAVMEAQVSCLKTELSQVARSLESERARAAESRQECLAAMEAAATHEGRANHLQAEVNDSKEKLGQALGQERSRRLAVEQELEKVRALRSEVEQAHQATDCANAHRRLPSVMSFNGLEGGQFLQASLDSYRTKHMEPLPPTSPHVSKGSLSAEHYEAVMRHKDGELLSHASRLAELESTRAALAEELVRSTTECERLRGEALAVRGLRAELEALRRRHASALELMGERDEQVEELRADLADVKEMYREQIDMLVSQIGITSSRLHQLPH